jgi:hypothetical protein
MSILPFSLSTNLEQPNPYQYLTKLSITFLLTVFVMEDGSKITAALGPSIDHFASRMCSTGIVSVGMAQILAGSSIRVHQRARTGTLAHDFAIGNSTSTTLSTAGRRGTLQTLRSVQGKFHGNGFATKVSSFDHGTNVKGTQDIAGGTDTLDQTSMRRLACRVGIALIG